MWPLIIAAAASILANSKKQEEAQRANYVAQLQRNAARFGGNTDLAEVYSNNRQIGDMQADYGGALKLAGAIDSLGGSSSDAAPAPGRGAELAQFNLDHSFVPQAGGNEDDLLDPWKKLRR